MDTLTEEEKRDWTQKVVLGAALGAVGGWLAGSEIVKPSKPGLGVVVGAVAGAGIAYFALKPSERPKTLTERIIEQRDKDAAAVKETFKSGYEQAKEDAKAAADYATSSARGAADYATSSMRSGYETVTGDRDPAAEAQAARATAYAAKAKAEAALRAAQIRASQAPAPVPTVNGYGRGPIILGR